MAIGLISPRSYVDPEIHTYEQQGLFRNSWGFVGLLFELQAGGHQGVSLGDAEVLLQCDDDGRPRAFANVCAHRHAQLCGPGMHSGRVRCPYHSWTYNRVGVPVGIPSKASFPEVVAEPEKYRLKEYACEAAGQFIFVRLSEDGPSLKEYLGSQYDFLERASQGMNTVLDEFREEVQANWKVTIENSLEGYHVPAVHKGTFGQIDGMSREEKSTEFFLDDPRHSYLEHKAEADWIAKFKQRVEPKVGKWAWRFEHYTHHLIFPNLTVTSFMGYSFHVQRFEPTAPDRTTVHSRTIGVQFEGGNEVGRKMMERIYEDGHAFTQRVFAEDGDICAKVQAGLRTADRLAVLGEGIEDRVLHFQRVYVNASAEK